MDFFDLFFKSSDSFALKRNGFEIVEEQIEIPDTQVYTVEEALELMQSRSIWHYVIKSGKEDIVLQNLKSYFESVQDKNGKIYRHQMHNFFIAKKIY